MECCRICLATNELSNIFETEELAPNITAIACVDISPNDGLPQYICLLCKHELDISINFKDKCETTFEMLKEQHNKEIEVKENIILNLLSGGNAMDAKLPERARRSILNTVKNSIKNDGKMIVDDCTQDKKYLIEMGKTLCGGSSILDKDNIMPEEGDALNEENNLKLGNSSEEGQARLKNISPEGINSTEFDDQILDAEDHMATTTDADDQMTDVTENEYEIPESLSIGNQDLMCAKCNFYFVNERCLFDHLTRIHSKTMGQCQICLVYFPTSWLLKDHLSAKHDVSDDNRNLGYSCKMCNKTFGLQSELNIHRCSLPDQKEFSCEPCQLNFKFEMDLENHIKYVHQQVEFTCEHCNAKFDLFEAYWKHLKEHQQQNPIEVLCSECNECFLSNEEWNKHVYSCHTNYNHNGKETKHLKKRCENYEKSFVCPLCEKCFKTYSKLEIHIRIHTGEKPHKCMYCHKSFAKSAHLTVHQRIHKGSKPHVCAICQMSFHKKNSLESHLLQHDNLINCTKEETYINFEFEENEADEEV